MKIYLLCFFVLGCSFSSAKNSSQKPPQVVSEVEIQKYQGTWFEIAKFPNRFQKNCVATTATYNPMKNKNIQVINRCLVDNFDGKERVAKGKAWVVDSEETAKLKVQFFWPFSGDYWILGLGDAYEWALVGSPDREFLWILSRNASMEEEKYNEIKLLAKQKGFSIDRLEKTPQKVNQSL